MALTVDPATKVFSVLQADLSFVSGTLYTYDTNVQRLAMMTLLATENYIWMDDPYIHAPEVTVAGVTYARTLQLVNGYSITLENTGAAYSASFEGSNSDFFDIENSKLNPTPLVTVLSNNSAGLQTVVSGSGVLPADITAIKDAVFNEIMEGAETFADQTRIIRADAAGDVDEPVDGTYAIRDAADTKDRIVGTQTANGGRNVTSVDGS